MTIELSSFVRDALAKGESRKDIQKALKIAGWQDDEIKMAVDAYAEVDFSVPVPKRKPYLSAGEAFRYLVLFLTLYFSAFSFGTILFQAINRWMPDLAYEGYVSIDSTAGAIRMATSTLVVAFPLFIWLSTITARAVSKDPDKRASRIRKWLTYITLFIAAAVIIGDVITLVYNFLGGELTWRFGLKCLTVGAITSAIFGYYLLDLRGDESEKDAPKKVLRHDTPGFKAFLAVILLSVTSSLVYGFWTSGAPATERAKRFDNQRMNDLQQISYAMDTYWNSNVRLPSNMEDLKGERNVYIQSINDPETGAPYTYTMTGEKTYELCATFSLPTADGQLQAPKPYTSGEQPFWQHGAGYSCFQLKAPPPPPPAIK